MAIRAGPVWFLGLDTGRHAGHRLGRADGLRVCCAVLAWSRVRFVRFADDERAHTTLRLLVECFETLGGVPKTVLAGWAVLRLVWSPTWWCRPRGRVGTAIGVSQVRSRVTYPAPHRDSAPGVGWACQARCPRRSAPPRSRLTHALSPDRPPLSHRPVRPWPC